MGSNLLNISTLVRRNVSIHGRQTVTGDTFNFTWQTSIKRRYPLTHNRDVVLLDLVLEPMGGVGVVKVFVTYISVV